MKSMCQEARRNSPSVADCKPTSFCIRTTSRMASSSAAFSSSSEIWPAACFSRASRRDWGRRRLPTWSALKGGVSRMGFKYPCATPFDLLPSALSPLRVAVVVLLPGRPVLRVPAGPVHGPAGQRVLEVVEVDVPAGEDLEPELLRCGGDVGEAQDAPVAVLAQLPAQEAVDVALVLDQARGVEAGDRRVHHRLVALLVGVLPAQDHLAALLQIDLGLGQPADQLSGLRQGGPHLVDRMLEATFEAQDLRVVLDLERAVAGHLSLLLVE